MPTRRGFLRTGTAALAAALPWAAKGRGADPDREAIARTLRGLGGVYPDLHRHFAFEYYPWYASDPARHWDGDGHTPPLDISSRYMPLLGAYDSRSRAVLTQHARWIADSGVGTVNLSWWGRDTFEDQAVPLVMDVMHDHGLKVAFHLEPYGGERAASLAADVIHILREYGEKRRFDALLLLRHGDGAVGPVFKLFASMAPLTVQDCQGRTFRGGGLAQDALWLLQLATLRETLRGSFDRVTVLSDSTEIERVARCGFDGIALYDNFVEPSQYGGLALHADARSLVFSFNSNPGFHMSPFAGPSRERDGCGRPAQRPPFHPATEGLDLETEGGREHAAARSAERIVESLAESLRLQADPTLVNAQRGFFLVYVNSFNEWHEGHSFEPMKDAGALRPEERRFGYHNPARGTYRLELLRELLRPGWDGVTPASGPPRPRT